MGMAQRDEASVTLLLAGGHTHALYLKVKDPLLQALVTAVGEKSQPGPRPPRSFNIRIDEGRRSLLFSSSDLVGLVTEPPLFAEGQAPAAGPVIEKSRYVMIENFIDPARHAELLAYVAGRESAFATSSVSTHDADYRRSLVLHEFPEFSPLFRDRIRSLVPQLVGTFGLGAFPLGDIECQLTAHNEGHYFKLHNDSGSPDTVTRAISYVFYFHNEPKAFSGGEFRLYDSRIANGRYECGEAAADIAPKNNSVLFFPSHCQHEVLPVRCPSGRFVDSRFTVNGWVRRAPG
jgi:SM-20-related protein